MNMESSVESLSSLHVNGSGSPGKLTTTPEQMRVSELEPRAVNVSKIAEYAELTPITIPIFDMMIELFDLHQDSNWPRKALFDAVQRLLGGRIERIVRDQVGKFLVESSIVDIMKQVQDIMWPKGVLRKDPPGRTAKEKAKTKRDAAFKLAAIFEGLILFDITNGRLGWKHYGPWKCSNWSNPISGIVSEYPFEYPFCIYCFR